MFGVRGATHLHSSNPWLADVALQATRMEGKSKTSQGFLSVNSYACADLKVYGVGVTDPAGPGVLFRLPKLGHSSRFECIASSLTARMYHKPSRGTSTLDHRMVRCFVWLSGASFPNFPHQQDIISASITRSYHPLLYSFHAKFRNTVLNID